LLDQGLLPAGANFFQGNIDPGTGRIHFLPEEGDSHEPAESAPAEAAPPEATPNFEIHVVDELGEAVPSMGLKLRHGDRTSDVETDERGIVELEDHDATTVSIALADPAGAKDALRSRWNALRGGASVAASPMVTAVSLHGQTPEVDARARVPHTLSLRPYVARGRLLGGFFDTSKAFLLPGGVAGIRAIVALYDEHAEAELLVVGHTDSAGSSAYNDALSLERAESLIAYLKDDTSAWLRFYGDSVPEAKRWGRPEDEAMIGALPDFAERKAGESPVRWFRRTRGLGPPADRADRATRQKLVEEYMALDGTTLPAGVSATAHGAGEHFPAVDVGDGVAEAANRRVDIFFFDAELGIQPPPGGKNSKAGSREYPEWVARAQRTDDFFYGASRPLLIQLLDVSGDPLSGAEYEVSGGSSSWSGVTDSRGMVHVDQVPRDARCLLRWKLPPPPGEPPPKESDFDFERELFLEFEDADRDEAARRRLHNLGYDAEELEENVRDFQNDFGLEEKPWRDEPTWAELLRVHDELGTKKAS
jgi:outer membrane protein OmpA-like peptidoglycan-associated protein